MNHKIDNNHNVKLERVITLPHLILYGMGTMIGAGIYVLFGFIADLAHFYTPFAFLIAGLVGLLTATSYAQLAQHFPQCAGAAVYVYKGFKNNYLSKIVGYLVILSGVVSCGALAKGFAEYAQDLVAIKFNFLVFMFILSISLIACWRINLSMWIISIISLIEILGLLFVVGILSPNFDTEIIVKQTLTFPSPRQILNILNAALLAFYAFIGFEDMVNVVEEVKQNTMKKGILYAFLFTSIIYFLIAIVIVASVDMNILTNQAAPFAVLLYNKTPIGSKLISIVSIIATINGGLIQIILSSRILYGMNRQNISASFFSRVNLTTKTPINAIIFTSCLIILATYFFPIEQLARITSVTVLIVFCLVNLSLITLIYKKAIPIKGIMAILMPLCGFITCSVLLITQLYIEINKNF